MPSCFSCGSTNFVSINNKSTCAHCKLKLRICSFCDCDQLKKQDNGWLVCTQCNSVDESYQEEELEFEDYSRQAKSAMVAESNENSSSNKYRGQEYDIPWTLVEAFQVGISF